MIIPFIIYALHDKKKVASEMEHFTMKSHPKHFNFIHPRGRGEFAIKPQDEDILDQNLGK